MSRTTTYSLTHNEILVIESLVQRLHFDGFLHASQCPEMRNGESGEASSAGVTILQIVQRRPVGVGLFGGLVVNGNRRDRFAFESEAVDNSLDLTIGTFGDGRPLRVDTSVDGRMEEFGTIGGRAPVDYDRWLSRDGHEVDPRTVALAVGPWFPVWFATYGPAVRRLVQEGAVYRKRVLSRLAGSEELRASLDSAMRLGGGDAADAIIVELAKQKIP